MESKSQSKKKYLVPVALISIILIVVISTITLIILTGNNQSRNLSQIDVPENSIPEEQNLGSENSNEFLRYDLQTDTSISLIDLDKVLSGGPGKDGIPSIDNPTFTSIQNASENIQNDTRGILYEGEEEVRFYPYNILVWHEIVNDKVDGKHIAFTFCPLCGSAIAYDREVKGEVLEFGVSGLLYESNLLMYDRQTETLWSQIEGRAVIGDLVGTELERVPIQLIEFSELKEKYPEAKILSEDTGYSRSYNNYPYGDYDNNDQLYFDVTYKDNRLQLKEIMVATVYENTPVAFIFDKLREEKSAEIEVNNNILKAKYEDSEVIIMDENGNQLPNFYTQWFSWANHNLPEGVNKDTNGIVWGFE